MKTIFSHIFKVLYFIRKNYDFVYWKIGGIAFYIKKKEKIYFILFN